MSKKDLIITTIAVSILGSLFYLSADHEGESPVKKDVNIAKQPIVSWQKITITEEKKNILIHITAPRVIIYDNYNLGSEINQTITDYLESLKSEFISGVSTAAEDNGETSALAIDTEALLITPRLISLSFTVAERLAGIKDSDPEQTFLVFDLRDGKVVRETHTLFRDDLAWSRAVKAIKKSLLSDYQGDPNCDLLFAPKSQGFAASCIGVDWGRGGEHFSVRGDIPVSMIQEFLAPAVLSDVIR